MLSDSTVKRLLRYLPAVSIWAGTVDDVSQIQEIHQSSRKAFRDTQYRSVLDKPVLSRDQLYAMADGGQLLVAELVTPERERTHHLVGFAAILILDGHAHIRQCSVRSDRQGMGIGPAIFNGVFAWAGRHGFRLVTLDTYREIKWNAPLFATLGFGVTPNRFIERFLGPEHAAILDDEARQGIDTSNRVVMAANVAINVFGFCPPTPDYGGALFSTTSWSEGAVSPICFDEPRNYLHANTLRIEYDGSPDEVRALLAEDPHALDGIVLRRFSSSRVRGAAADALADGLVFELEPAGPPVGRYVGSRGALILER